MTPIKLIWFLILPDTLSLMCIFWVKGHISFVMSMCSSYWYKNGCLKPDMMTVFIALDRCVKANGCLQVNWSALILYSKQNQSTKSSGTLSADICLRWLYLWYQVLKGTQRCGRIEHELVAGQTQASRERVHQLSKHFTHLHCEMNPGKNYKNKETRVVILKR